MTTIRARLTLRLFVSLIVVFALLWLVVSVTIHKITGDFMASRLERDAEIILAALAFPENGSLRLNASRLSEDYRRIFSGQYYLVAAAGERRRSRSLWDFEFALPAASSLEDTRLDVAGPREQRLLVLVRHYLKQGAPVTITVAEDMQPVLDDVRDFNAVFGVVALIALIALVLLQRAGIKDALKPLDATQADIARLEHGEAKMLDEQAPGEIKPLVREINRLLRLLNERLRRSRNAIGNMAHALKGPLTELNHLTDALDRKTAGDLRGQAHAQIEAIRTLIERELKRARLAGGGSPGAVFEPRGELAILTEAVRRLYPEKSLEFDLRVPPGRRYPADREDMLELIGNLLDNACKWAERTVRVTVTDEPGLALIIEDDGPGVRDKELKLLTQRGARLDENTAGHGLGLAIARDIVDQYQGELLLGRSDALGGFKVSVCLPSPMDSG